MAPLGSSIQLPTQQRSLNKTLGEEEREAMRRETMTRGKKTLRPSVRWDSQIMAGVREEIAVGITKEVVIRGIEAPITTMEATTTATGEEGDRIEVVTISKKEDGIEVAINSRKGKEAGITMEKVVRGAKIKMAVTKEREVATVIKKVILREVKEGDTTAWEEVEQQEGAAIKRANN